MNKFDENSPFLELPTETKSQSKSSFYQYELESYTPFLDSRDELLYEQNDLNLQQKYLSNEEEFIDGQYENVKSVQNLLSEVLQFSNIASNPFEGELVGTEWAEAGRLNLQFMNDDSLKWGSYSSQIISFLSQYTGIPILQNGVINPYYFVSAVDKYQQTKGLKPTNKGVIAIGTWSVLQKDLGLHNLSNSYNINVSKAASDNKYYERKIWGSHKEAIYKLFADYKIVSIALPLDSERFAYAIADFQALKGGLTIDGVLGPNTYALLQKTVLAAPSIPPASLTPSRWRTIIPDAVQSPVETYVNGIEAFREIAKAIKTAKGKGHFIYLLSGWVAESDFCLSPNEDKNLAGIDTSSSLQNLLKQTNVDVEVKILSWNNPKTLAELSKGEKFINELRAAGKNAVMLRDNFTYGTEFMKDLMRKIQGYMNALSIAMPALNNFDFWNEKKAQANAFPNQGSHHEKILVVNGSEGLIAFCGGMDINANRIMGLKGFCCGHYLTTYDCDLEKDSHNQMRSQILHDVHCKLRGKAAEVLLQRFIDRWNLHLSQYPQSIPQLTNNLPGTNVQVTATTPYVKVLHTFNHPVNKSIKDRSILNMVELAIKNARKSIAIECQYMISPEIAIWLNQAVLNNKSLRVALYTQDDEFAGELMFAHFFRHRFRHLLFKGLDSTALERINIYMLDPLSNPPNRRRVHSKTYIIDNELAIIGSANCNRRSMTFDSETSVVIYQDGEPSQSMVKTMNDRIRNDKYNKWIPYRENFSMEAMDINVKIQTSPYFIAPVSIISIGGGMAVPLVAQNLLETISALLREAVDPHPDDEPNITKEVESEFAEIDIANETEMIEQAGPFKSIAYESPTLYENDNFNRSNYANEDELAHTHCSCRKKANELTNSGSEIAETIVQQETKINMTCEDRTCWAKSVLNNLYGISLAINNILDEQTKNAISDFQLKNNLPQTKLIDAVTERALLEADAIQKQGTTAVNIIANAKTKIEDWTKQAVVDKPEITGSYRDPRKLWAFVLHHMAFKRRNRAGQLSDPKSYLKTGAHFCIMFGGRIIQLHPLSRMIWHGNCLSPRSVAVEFEGNFPDIKGRWWFDRKKYKRSPDEDHPSQAQYEAGRFLASYLKIVLGTTHILAHRQSSDSRENDPGPDIWYNVGQWTMDNLGLTDGGPTFKCGTGNPILPEWKTWGNKSSNISSEFNKAIDTEEWEDNTNILSPQNKNGEDYYPEDEDVYYEMDEFVKDWSNAVRLNRYYADKLGWNQFYDKINDMLLPLSGLQNVSLGEEAFAQAVAAWQQQQGFSEKDADGIIGPQTWSIMQHSIPGTLLIRSSGSLPSWVDTLTPLLNKYRGDIPLDFLLGWIAIESNGKISVVTKLNERGYFQIHPDESKALKLLSHERLSTDSEYSIASGIALVKYLSLKADRYAQQLNINKGSDLYWHLVKMLHWLPGGVKLIIDDMVNRGVKPVTWEDFKTDVLNRSDAIKESMRRTLGKVWEPSQGINNVEKLFKEAARLSPKYNSNSMHESEDYYTAPTYEVFEQDNGQRELGELEDFDRKSFEDNVNSKLQEFFSFVDIFKKNWLKAIELNRSYGMQLGWNRYYDHINNLLLPFSGQQNVSLGEEAFAQAVAAWQQQQGLTADGIIGPNTWSKMKVLLNSGALSQPIQPATFPSGSTPPAIQNIFDFNRWHAKSILDTMNNGVIGQNFHSKDQLEKIVRGEQVLNVNPQTKIIQILPILYHIAEQARLENYKEIIFGSFIRPPSGDKCTGHCVGRCIDINYTKGSFETSDSTQMVIRVLRYLLSLPQQYKSSIGFGMPLQGSFFGHKSLTKFKSADLSNLNDTGLQELIRQLGYVFPDNNNHLHIQVNWLHGIQSETSYETLEIIHPTDETDLNTGIEKYIPDFENYSFSYRLNKVADWAYLLGFKVPDDIVAMLKKRNMYVQYAHNESYSNDLNVDFYRLRIYRYPTINGVVMNAERLIKYIRLNINNLVDTSYCDFYPYNALIDTPLWNSDNPRGSVLKLNIKGPDNASVVVSLSKSTGWRFSTIHAPDTGDHPVSGHREFFIGTDPATNGTYFVIKGLDMMSTGVAGLGLPFAGEWGFGQADALWKSMREKIINLINSNGGTAKTDLTYSERIEWRFVYHSYKNLLEQTFGKGAGSAENSPFFDFQIETSVST